MKNVTVTELKSPGEMCLARGRTLSFAHPLVMGILNCTPDSFSDGGKFNSIDSAVAQAVRMETEGAAIIDIGGESTRPGAEQVSAEEERKRVVPVIAAIRTESDIPISIDTTKASVARAAIAAGADIINDISALSFDSEMAAVVRESQVPVILMHMQGTPQTMQQAPQYDSVVKEIIVFLQERKEFCELNGIAHDRIIIDPGIGFGKRLEDNLAILKHLQMFTTLNCPVLVGVSRKSFIEKLMGTHIPADSRLGGSLTAALISVQRGAAIVRVHDVAETVQALRLLEAVTDKQE